MKNVHFKIQYGKTTCFFYCVLSYIMKSLYHDILITFETIFILLNILIENETLYIQPHLY